MALREINLTPSEVLARREFLRHLGFWAGCLLISLSLIWGFYFLQDYTLLAKRRKVAELKKMHLNLGAKIDEIKVMRAELNSLRQEQSGLENITLNKPYSRIFAELSDLINEHTWLTQLNIDSGLDEETTASLKLTGFSFSAEELGNFLDQLTADPLFKTVVLQQAREDETVQLSKNTHAPIRLIQFNIECSI
ncbi:MAG: PilN domain-containing protein [Deltaproteobacteria bacterium]|nr:PilN domain-containing protein [Deltaproteobacteria bacterium]